MLDDFEEDADGTQAAPVPTPTKASDASSTTINAMQQVWARVISSIVIPSFPTFANRLHCA